MRTPTQLSYTAAMSVFTPISDSAISSVIAPLGLTLVGAQAATHGIENSNYLLRCADANKQPIGLVLTLFEQRPAAQLPWFAALLSGLAEAKLPVPAPISVGGGPLLQVEGKPGFLVPWLPGAHVFQPNEQQCLAVGQLLASLHQCPTPRGEPPHSERRHLRWLAEQLPRLSDTDRGAANEVLDTWQHAAGRRTLIHADLFRDNVLFDGDHVSGLLDLYNACSDLPIYDVAVTLNDWCVDDDGRLVTARMNALLSGYQQCRPLSDEEMKQLPLALATAGLRFYLSRLAAQQSAALHADAQGTVSKDPEPFRQIFLQRYRDWKAG
ncbi:MAG: homoserine kinase [Alcanivoracaceae bacterium]|nr:homoserine kinase [Alcanivoracaceae bacterium]